MHTLNRNHGGTVANVIGSIAIFIILVLFLGPVFIPPRDSYGGRRYTCQCNIKECVIALQLYWNDYDGKLPSSMLVRHSKTWNQRDFEEFASIRGEQPPGKHPTTWSSMLYNHMKNKDIMFCLQDDVDTSKPESRVSYYWKTAVDKAWYGVGCKKLCRVESDFKYISNQVVLYERDAFHWGGGGLKDGAQINVAYMDSHVKTIYIQNATSRNPNDPISCTDGEPMYFNCEFNDDYYNLNSGKAPAKYIDPQRYADKL